MNNPAPGYGALIGGTKIIAKSGWCAARPSGTGDIRRDSGEGRWTIQAAIDEAVPMDVLSAALYERFTSRGEAQFANRLLSAMRHEFGGHAEKKG